MPEPSPEAIDEFIGKWSESGGHERGSGQYFLLDFCDLLDLGKPDPPVPENERNKQTGNISDPQSCTNQVEEILETL